MGQESIGLNKVCFVTFNYDRSLEQALFRRAKHTFTRSAEQEQARDLLSNLPVVHVHGQIGNLPWRHKATGWSNVGDRDYDTQFTPEDIQSCAKGILLAGECRPDLETYERARHLLSKAERVHFLGFAYHRVLIERIRPDHWHSGVVASGTHKGLGQVRAGELHNTNANDLGIRIVFHDTAKTVSDYFAHVVGG